MVIHTAAKTLGFMQFTTFSKFLLIPEKKK